MKVTGLRVLAIALACCMGPLASAAIIIPTNQGPWGADAEIRDHELVVNRGASFELATRSANNASATVDPVADGNDRASEMYLRFSLAGVTAADLNGPITVRLHNGTRSETGARVNDLDPANTSTQANVQLAYRGLVPSKSDGWAENTLTWLNAPGLTADSEVGNRDYNSDLSLLGTYTYGTVFPQSNVPVGYAVDFVNAPGSPLHSLIASSLGVANSVTIVVAVTHPGVTGFDPSNWINYNYVFIPKEVTVLNNTLGQPNNLNDTTYNPDTTLIPPPPLGSPFLNASNATGDFSPKLIFEPQIVPEPASLVLVVLGAGALALGLRRKAA